MSDVINVDIQEENPIEIIEVYVDENAAQTAIDAAALAQLVLAELLLITGNIPEINTIIIDNGFHKEGQLFTGFADTLWNVSGTRYTNPTDQEITIPLCDTGLVRQDRIVLDTNNNFVLVPGEEVESNPVPPVKPINTLDYTFIPVSDSEVGEPEAPIVGDYFLRKSFDRSQIYTGTAPGTDVVIPLDYKGRRVIILQGTIANIKGLSMSLIESHSPASENPHEGKIFTFINETPNPITFNYFEASEDIFFISKSETDIVVPSKERIDFMFRTTVMEEHYKSWTTIDDVIDLQDELDLKADLVSGKVPSSQLPSYVDDIIEGYLLSNVFYVESGHTTVIPAETGKIYIDITTGQKNKEYRYSGSTYIQITNGLIASTDDVSEGSANLYFEESRVLASLLGGLSATSGTFTSSSSLLFALGKIKYLIDNISTLYVPQTRIINIGGVALDLSADRTFSIDVQVYKTIASNTTLDNTYHNAIVWVTATANITLPTGLRSDFACTFRTLTGAIGTFVTSGTTINSESDGDVMAEKTMSLLATYSSNNFIISGGGLS